ncbi:MAG: alpha/beta hydrolase [Bacteroidota bacterium]
MMRNLIRIASAIAPGPISRLAYDKLTNPQLHKLRLFEEEVLAKADVNWEDFQGKKVCTYRWGSGNRRILLIHGWEGQAGNFWAIVDALLAMDYTVYAFDAPSHGRSDKGPTSMFAFTDWVKYQIQSLGVNKLISHSFGGVATTYALSQLPETEIEQYLMITTPDRFSQRIQDVSEQVGINETVKQRLIDRLTAETKQDLTKLNVSDFVQQIKVKEALIIHDRDDRVIPLSYSEGVHAKWPQSRLEVIEGTGHYRILSDAQTLTLMRDFLN